MALQVQVALVHLHASVSGRLHRYVGRNPSVCPVRERRVAVVVEHELFNLFAVVNIEHVAEQTQLVGIVPRATGFFDGLPFLIVFSFSRTLPDVIREDTALLVSFFGFIALLSLNCYLTDRERS